MQLRPRQNLDKYRIVRRIAQGGFADVWEALDTVEGIRVALKIPRAHLIHAEALADFRREVRLTAQLDHPNILPIKNASFIGRRFVIVYPLAERTLAARMRHRLGVRTVMGYTRQMLDALAHAHQRNVIHCDLKPENFLLFRGERLRLDDFGIAKISLRTLSATGSGTLGYIAPEQAMGKPNKSSDVFSLGLIVYQMLAGELPAWPFDWPPPGLARVRQKLWNDGVRFLARALEVDQRDRFPNAGQMLRALDEVESSILAHDARRRRRMRR